MTDTAPHRSRSDVDFVTGRGRLVSLSRGIVWAFLVLALVATVATLLVGFGKTVGHPVSLQLVAETKLPAAADAGPATLVSGTYSAASVELTDLSPAATILATVAAFASVLAAAAVPAAIAVIAWRLLRRGKVFRRHLSTTVTALGAVLLIGGVIAQGGQGLASGLAAHELNPPGRFHGFWPIAGRFDPTFLGFGVVLLLVGLAFEYGGRLQKDTEGLV